MEIEKNLASVSSILLQSITVGRDRYIAWFAFAAVICFAICVCSAIYVKEKCPKPLYWGVHFFNNMFITLTSLFPQLGFLGTVVALLRVKLDLPDSESNVLTQFMNALTSTAWGIFFFCVFNVLYAGVKHFIEVRTEEARRLIAVSESKS